MLFEQQRAGTAADCGALLAGQARRGGDRGRVARPRPRRAVGAAGGAGDQGVPAEVRTRTQLGLAVQYRGWRDSRAVEERRGREGYSEAIVSRQSH